MAATSEVSIWQRMIEADGVVFSAEAAKTFLKLDFAPSDRRRMNELSDRVQHGQLSTEERNELGNYIRAGHLLALIQSKSRRAIKISKSSRD